MSRPAKQAVPALILALALAGPGVLASQVKPPKNPAKIAVSVTPEAVARRLIGRGRTLMDSGAMALGDEQRARHLLNGAQRALDREDYTRAIQRAFYACQVMEGVREKPEPPYLDGSAEADSAGPAASGGEPIP